MADICSRIRELRLERGMTQGELAAVLNLVQQTVSDYENPNKKAQPSFDVMLQMADLFSVSLDYLAGRSDLRYFELSLPDKKARIRESEFLSQYKGLPAKQREAIKTLVSGYYMK